jgi:hypothetical protein
MQKFPTTCAVEIAGPSEMLGTEPFMAALEREAVDLGATLHWGQRNNLRMKQVEMVFDPNGPAGALFRWRKVLSALSSNGRLATFSTEFTRVRGLEVVQPLLQSFEVKPFAACADSQVDIEWSALDNPPGTVALLEVRPSGSGGTPVSTVALPSLSGTQKVMLPAGRSDLRLVVAYTLNGRTMSDDRTLQVQGFQEHDVWTFELPATCLFIDGAWRWGVELPFSSQFVSNSLRVEELFCYFDFYTTWIARTGGMTDVPFTWLKNRKALTDRPILNASWSFFFSTPGCLGTTPTFHAEFKLTCT